MTTYSRCDVPSGRGVTFPWSNVVRYFIGSIAPSCAGWYGFWGGTAAASLVELTGITWSPTSAVLPMGYLPSSFSVTHSMQA